MSATVLITRPKGQADAFAAALSATYGGPVRRVISPLIAISPLPVAGDFADTAHVVFTSVNGVRQADRIGIPGSAVAWCVGQKTAQAAADQGFSVHVGGGDSQNLVTRIVAQAPVGRMVHVRGRHVAGDVVGGLAKAGIRCETIVAYDQAAVSPTRAALDLLSAKNPVIVPLFSPRTAEIFWQIPDIAAPLHVISISDAVDRVPHNAPLASRQVAVTRDRAGMVAATLARYAEISP